MTERLSQLMRAEADALDIPAPPAMAAYDQGRRLRRRQQLTTGVVACAAVTVLTAGAFALLPDGGHDAVASPYSAEKYADIGALAVDRELYVGGSRVPFDEAVKSFYYTSDGVVVRSGKSPWTMDGDVDHYTLVRPDGTRKSVDLRTRDRVIGTEPDSTHLAYVEANGTRWDVVVIDVSTGEELARHTVEGNFHQGWEAPPAAIDGDLVWVDFDENPDSDGPNQGRMASINWRTGDVRTVPGQGRVGWPVNGYYVYRGEREQVVRRMVDDSEVVRIEEPADTMLRFSPDGQWLKVYDGDFTGQKGDHADPARPYVVNVRTGSRQTLTGQGWDYGWTPTGVLITVDRTTGNVQTCDPATGRCSDAGIDFEIDGDTVIKLGGNDHES